MLLKDRISIVTGGSSGIGRGIALEFAREGARIVIADIQDTPLQGKYHEIVVGINLRGVFMSTKLAIPHLKKSKFGRIIQIASVHAYGGGAGPAYASAKAAVVNMVRDTALEIGKYGITVNTICPGYIETAIQDYLTPEQVESSLKKTPLQRLGLPKDIGRAAVS